MSDQNSDPELQALQQVIKALESLEADARTRVLTYVFQRLGLPLSVPNLTQPPLALPLVSALPLGSTDPAPHGKLISDIRSLKEAKQPKSDNQMATLIAYYLKEVAPASDHKDTISQDDVEKYFKQAGFPLPNKPAMTLVNAKNAGYLDSAGVGLYRLNPVGHNLVAHGMPSSSGDGNRNTKKAKTKKSVKKRT